MTELQMDFIIHTELDQLLGGAGRGARGGQQRRRLTKRGWLPEPTWIHGDRTRIGVYPEFVLAALVPGNLRSMTAQQRQLLERLNEITADLYRSSSFGLMAEALRGALAMASRPSELISALRSEAPDALLGWQTDVATAAEQLKRYGFGFEATAARVAEVRPDAYVLEDLGDTIITEAFPRQDATTELESGAWVVRDRVSVSSAARAFLLEIPEEVAMDRTPAIEEKERDEVMMGIFAGLEAPPAAIPMLGPARLLEDQPAQHTSIDVPLDLLVNANAMTRHTP